MRFIIIAAALMLGGCAGVNPATVGGSCRIFTDPGFAVQGRRTIDRRWIGATQEKGIAICGWQRPQR